MNDEPSRVLTREQIMSLERFREAVIVGGMNKRHYAQLCAMAIACLEMIEEAKAENDAIQGDVV